MLPKKFIFALFCSVGVAMPFAVMAQMPTQSPSGMSKPSGTIPAGTGGGMTPATPGGMMKSPVKNPSNLKPVTTTTAKPSVNSATLKELVKVNGIGTATAKKIIASRPYATLDDLVTKKVLTKKQLVQLETKIGL